MTVAAIIAVARFRPATARVGTLKGFPRFVTNRFSKDLGLRPKGSAGRVAVCGS